MKDKTARRTRQKDLSAREIGTLPWSYLVVIAICGCIVAAGFLLAARQHFVSMDLGMKNSKLRKQLEDLEAEKRRLTFAREVALSPMELTRTARSLGFVDAKEERAPAPAADIASAPATRPEVTGTVVKASQRSTPAAPVIAKTAFQRPAKAPDKQSTPTNKPREPEAPRSAKPGSQPTRERIVPAARLR